MLGDVTALTQGCSWSPIAFKQNKKMKRKQQEKVKWERRRDGLGHSSPDPSP